MYPLDPVVGGIVCSSFALLFVVAGAHKWRARTDFAATLAGYRVLPARLLAPASVLVPTLECAIAVAVLIPETRTRACLAGATLLLGYAGAMGLNLRRGRRHLDCGCLGPRGGGVVSPALVSRNMLLALVLASAGTIRWSGRAVDWLDVVTVLAAVCAMALLYTAMNGLLAVAARHAVQRG